MSTPISQVGLRRSTLQLGHRTVSLRHGDFVVSFFRDLARGESAMAIVCGELDGPDPIRARVHSSCLTSECLMGRDCDCAEQLDGALASMSRAGAGVLFYLMQEGRGAGLTAKARDRMIVQASGNRLTTFEAYAEMGLPSDLRRYDVVAPMSRMLGIRAPISLLTNNPEKAAAVAKSLAEEGIEVCRTEPIHGPTSDFNSDYLSAKHESGHELLRPDGRTGAMPPARVRLVPPVVLPGEPNRILTASYFLPVGLSDADASGMPRRTHADIEWFRLSVVFDCATARESILMRPAAAPQSAPAAPDLDAGSCVTMSLLDRLPIDDAPGRHALRRSLRSIHQAGVGVVRVEFDDRDRGEH